jgi:hypothetical protein
MTLFRMPRGFSKMPTYRVWKGMKTRCYNPNATSYKYYGGRGITITWPNFEAFFTDMGVRPDGLTIDRIDSAGNYSKENCRWATWTQQNRSKGLSIVNKSGVKGVYWNKQKNKWRTFITVRGKTISLGYHKTLEAAAAARKEGEFAHWPNDLVAAAK